MKEQRRKLVIAIDGPSGSGKTTTARLVAKRLGYVHVDTGAMYRALALKALRRGVDLEDASQLESLLAATTIDCCERSGVSYVLLDGHDVTEAVRRAQVTTKSSQIAALPQVRRWMVARQRKLGEAGGVVMEGRDIGTVVLTDADVKIYLDAAPAERARRRWLEDSKSGTQRGWEEVLREISERDHRDMTRRHSPLEAAPDAVVIETSGLTLEAQVARVLEEIEKARGEVAQ
ncbi:MAG: (d)CMP kinase [Candidatus Eisenbacteria bacterium]